MSANLLVGVTPELKNGTTESDGVWHNAERTSTDSHVDWLVWDLAGQTALATDQTYHVGLSTKGAGANSASLRFAIGYKDAAGHTNWANSNLLPIGTSWGRAEATIVVPSGMTPFAFYVAAYGACPETWMTAATLSLGSPVTLASSAHTPYATQNHVSVTYATKSQLKVTDTELSGKVSDALTTAKAYTDSSIETEVTNRNAAIKAQADSISLSVSKTYAKYETFSAYQTDADGRIATANSNASTAVSTAKTAASDAATAKTNASTAVTTANSASTSAANAVKTANAASSSAASAVETANNAQKAADKAQSSADDTAAALAKAAVRIRIDGTPMADGTSQLMAHVYVGNDEVSANAIAKLGTLVWKMDGVADRRGTTTYTAQTGKFVTCRLEA